MSGRWALRHLSAVAYAVARSIAPEGLRRMLRPVTSFLYRRRICNLTRRTPNALTPTRRRYTARRDHVVFIAETPRGREAKLAHALRSKGWTVTLLYKAEPNYSLSKYFDECIRFATADQAVTIGISLTPIAYHLFSLAGDETCTRVINARIGPVVFDSADVLEAAYQGIQWKLDQVASLIQMQRYAIRHADAYCARDLQFKYAERTLSYYSAGKVIFFPEYCWGTAALPALYSDAHPSRPIRCVQAGNFGLEKRGEGDWGYLQIAERFIDARVTLHLFPNWFHYASSEAAFSETFSDYLDLARQSQYFKLHRPVQADEVAQRLAEYDFGVSFTWAEVSRQPATSLNLAATPYVMSARIFDYLDAGLPVVLGKSHRLIHAMLRRYKVGVVADEDFIAHIEQRLRPMANIESRKQAVAASRGLSIHRNIDRLASFYYRVAKDVGVSAGSET
jgi:hypothetical protein